MMEWTFLVCNGGVIAMDAAGRFRTLWEEAWLPNIAPDAGMLIACYRHPSRHYHNVTHIVQCLEVLAAYEGGGGGTVPADVRLAVFYHNAVYDSMRKDNEEASARVAKEAISPWLPEARVRKIEQLIQVTSHLIVPILPEEQLIVDADLSILGMPSNMFDAYEVAIRREYAWVAEDKYRLGRAAILRNFLNRAAIYSTQWFHGQYEAAARVNLERSLARLGEAVRTS